MKLVFKTKPRRHQVAPLKKLIRNRGGALQVPMRYGKTWIAINFVQAMRLKEGYRRVLVICPLSVVGVWEDEIRKHSGHPWVLLDEDEHPVAAGAGLLDEPGYQDVLWATPPTAWRVVNFHQVFWQEREKDGGWYPVPNESLRRFRPDIVIVDESHHIGNPTAIISKYTYLIGRESKSRVIMTGTMFHRKPFYVFGQFKFLDDSIFGTAFGAFKKQIAVFGGYGNYEVLRYQNLSWMMRKIKPVTFISKKVPKQPDVVNELKFNLTDPTLRHYSEMEREAATKIDGEWAEAPIILTKHLRCQQLAGGWVTVNGKAKRVGTDKLRMGEDRLAEYAEQEIDKFVVGCRFLPHLKDAAQAAKKAGYAVLLLHGGLSGPERSQRIRAFAQTKRPTAFISQVAAGREGIDLSAASTMLFWSLPESYVDFDQFRNRIYVVGDSRTLMYDYLIANGTRDEVTLQALLLKQDVADFIASDPKRVERITAKKRT